MALSNWDTMMVGVDGKPLAGTMVFPSGVEVEIYKNWIHIKDEKACNKDSSLMKPYVMTITSGDMSYKGINILALRGPQNGCYLVVWQSDYNVTPAKIIGAVGCGVYGFGDNGEFIGVTKESIKWFMDEMNKKEMTPWTAFKIGENGKEEIETGEFELSVYDIPDELKKLDLSNAVRYNQGDAFFATNLGTPLQQSEAGQSQTPIMLKMIKGDEKK